MIQVVAELVAVQGVGAINFLTASNASIEALKSATLLKSLKLNALITGQKGVGKKTLASYMMENAVQVDAAEHEKIIQLLQSVPELIILHIEHSPNIGDLLKHIEKSTTKVVATTFTQLEIYNTIFTINISLPPLNQRKEDIALLVEKFKQEATAMFNVALENFEFVPDVSQNAYSLRKQIYLYAISHDISEHELMDLVEHYLSDKLGSNGDYVKFLPLYEVPLIRTGLKQFKSQLQLAEKLGLNRNTLRKKIAQNKEYNLYE